MLYLFSVETTTTQKRKLFEHLNLQVKNANAQFSQFPSIIYQFPTLPRVYTSAFKLLFL